jgi:hypothetical protein
VAAHEVGHAIYNLETVATSLGNPSIVTLLEEPRAELTAMFTLRLLFEKQMLDRSHLNECLVHFALDALRYFTKFNSEPLRPYIIFQVYAYRVYSEHGYLSFNGNSGLVEINEEKTLDVLDTFSSTYLKILDAEDRMDGDELQRILDDLSSMVPFVERVVAMVFP